MVDARMEKDCSTHGSGWFRVGIEWIFFLWKKGIECFFFCEKRALGDLINAHSSPIRRDVRTVLHISLSTEDYKLWRENGILSCALEVSPNYPGI